MDQEISNQLARFYDYFRSIDWSRIPIWDRDLTVLDAIIAVLSLFFAWKGWVYAREDRKKSQLEESVPKPRLAVELYGTEPSLDYVLFAPFPESSADNHSNTRFGFSFPLTIGNSTDFTAEDVEVLAQMNSSLYAGSGLERVPGDLAEAKGVVTANEMVGGQEISTVLWSLGTVHSDTSFTIMDMIFSSYPTHELELSTEATTADGVDVVVHGNLSIAFKIKISVSAKNFPTETFEFSLAFRVQFDGDLESYILSRRGENGQLNELDIGKKAYVVFREFSPPEWYTKTMRDLQYSIESRDSTYKKYLKEVMLEEAIPKGPARKRLLKLLDQKVLFSQDFDLMIGEGREIP